MFCLCQLQSSVVNMLSKVMDCWSWPRTKSVQPTPTLVTIQYNTEYNLYPTDNAIFMVFTYTFLLF